MAVKYDMNTLYTQKKKTKKSYQPVFEIIHFEFHPLCSTRENFPKSRKKINIISIKNSFCMVV